MKYVTLRFQFRYENFLAPPPEQSSSVEVAPLWGEHYPKAHIWLSSQFLKKGDLGDKPSVVVDLFHGDIQAHPHSRYSNYDKNYIYTAELKIEEERISPILNQRAVLGIRVYANSRNQDNAPYHAPAGVTLIEFISLWNTRNEEGDGAWHCRPLLEHVDAHCEGDHLQQEAEDSDLEEEEFGVAAAEATDKSELDRKLDQERRNDRANFPEYALPAHTFTKGVIQIRIANDNPPLPSFVRVEANPSLTSNGSIRRRMRNLIIRGLDLVLNERLPILSRSVMSIECPTFSCEPEPLPGSSWSLVQPSVKAKDEMTRQNRVEVLHTFLKAALSMKQLSEDEFSSLIRSQLRIKKETKLLPGFTNACETVALAITLFSNSLPYTDDVLDARRWQISLGKHEITNGRSVTVSADKYMDIRMTQGGDCDDSNHACEIIAYEYMNADLGPAPPTSVIAARNLLRMCYIITQPHMKVSAASAEQQKQEIESITRQRGGCEADIPGINHITCFAIPVWSMVHWLRIGMEILQTGYEIPDQLLRPELDPESSEYRPWLRYVQPLANEGTGTLPPCMLMRDCWPDENPQEAQTMASKETVATILRKQLEEEIPELKKLKKPLTRANEGKDLDDLLAHPHGQVFYKTLVGFSTTAFLPYPYGLYEEEFRKDKKYAIGFHFISRRSMGRPEEDNPYNKRIWCSSVGVNSLVASGLSWNTTDETESAFDSIGVVPDVVLRSKDVYYILEMIKQHAPVPTLQLPKLSTTSNNSWEREKKLLLKIEQTVKKLYPLPPSNKSKELLTPISYYITKAHLTSQSHVLHIISQPHLAEHSKIMAAEFIQHFAVTTELQPNKAFAILAEFRLYLQLDVANITRM